MDTHQKNISDTEFKFENTRNLQKLKDIVGKEIAYHDLESHCEDEERGFLMNQIHEMMNVFNVHSLFTEINFQRKQYA